MAALNKYPFLYSSLETVSAVKTLGVLDPNGEYFALSVAFDTNANSGIRLNPDDIALEASTDYTVKFFARNTGAGSAVNVRLGLDVSGETNVSFTVSNTEWTEYSHTFNSGSNTVLDTRSRINNESAVAGLEIEFYCLRFYKDIDGDPLADIENQASTTHFTDFSEYTTGVAPSDWTERLGTDAVTDIVADAGAEGGKYLELTRTTSGTELFTWDDIDADANRANGQVLMKFRSDAGYGIAARNVGTEPDHDTIIMALSTAGLGNLDYINGSIDRFDEQDLTEVPLVANTYFYLELQFNHDAVLGRAWNASSGSRPTVPNVAVGVKPLAGGNVGIGNFSANNIDVDTYEFKSGTPWYVSTPSGSVTFADGTIYSGVTDWFDAPYGTKGALNALGQSTVTAGVTTCPVGRTSTNETFAITRGLSNDFSGTVQSVSTNDIDVSDTGVDLTGISMGGANDDDYRFLATAGTGIGEEVVITDRVGNVVTVPDGSIFDNTTEFVIGRRLEGFSKFLPKD